MKRLLLFGLLAAAPFWMAVSTVVLSRFEARTEGSDVIVSWQASVETDVRTYVLERKTRYDVQYVEVARVAARGANQPHEFRDTRIYKTVGEMVQYRLRVVYDDQSFVLVDPISVDYTPTAVRRTWGSIKAMFQ